VNISDGTNTYKFGLTPAATLSAGAAGGSVIFTPAIPIPATTANNTWSIALSAADATVSYFAQFIKEQAS
jgi:hypothetical protein